MKKNRKRIYDSSSRREAAGVTRRAILDAAYEMFIEKGYVAATMPSIAQRAGVALDTVYATVGKKPALFQLLIETAISGTESVSPAEERDYVRSIRAEPDASEKLRIYAAALRRIQQRLAPLFRVLQGAAPLDPKLEALWNSICERRAKNMRLFAVDLEATGRLRPHLPVARVADVIWSMNSPEFYLLFVEGRGWSPHEFEQWLVDAWVRLLLEP